MADADKMTGHNHYPATATMEISPLRSEGSSSEKPKKKRSHLTFLMMLVIFFSAMTGLLMGYDLCVIAVILEPITDEYGVCPKPMMTAFPLTEDQTPIAQVSRVPPLDADFASGRFLDTHSALSNNNFQQRPSRRLSPQPCPYCYASKQHTRKLDESKDQFVSCPSRQLFVGVVSPGAAVGSLIAGLLADAVGRRLTLALSDAMIMAGTLMMSLSQLFGIAIAGRFLLGFGVGTGFVVFSTYVSEISPPDRRGQLVSCQEVAQCVGCMTAYGVAALTQGAGWRWMLTTAGLVAATQACGILILPESPRWLIRHGKREKAEQSLRKLAGLPQLSASPNTTLSPKQQVRLAEREANAMQTMRDMLAEIERDKHGRLPKTEEDSPSFVKYQAEQTSPFTAQVEQALSPVSTQPEIFPGPLERDESERMSFMQQWRFTLQLCRKHWWPICIAAGTAVCQNFTAHQAVLNYSSSIYELAGVSDPLVAGVGIGAAKTVGIILVILFVERFGRKRFLLLGSFGTFLCHCTLGIAFVLQAKVSSGPVADAVPIIAIVAMILYMFCINISWAGLMFVVATEALPSSVRGIGMGFTITTFWLLAFLTQSTLESLIESIGTYGLFFFYASTNALAIVFTWFCIPELGGKTLEQITQDL